MNPLPYAWNNLLRRPLRNWLTILGVIIGVAAIIGLINVGNSLQDSVIDTIENAGAKIITVSGKTPGIPGSSADLTNKDLDVVEKMSEFSSVGAMLTKSKIVKYNKETKQVFVSGMSNAKEIYKSYGILTESGRFFRNQDTKVVVVGNSFGELYDTEIILGSQIIINDKKYKIIGVLETVGSPQDDTGVYMPFDEAEKLFGTENLISLISAIVKPGLNVNKIAEKTTKNLKKARNNEDFDVSTPEQLIEQFGMILSIVNVVVLGVAAISLLVGAVGIINSMYTSVLERTKEIGIMKATGATNEQILSIFITESALIGFIGGIIGTTIGLGIGKMVELASSKAGYTFLTVKPSIGLIIFGLSFATIFGALSGLLPAKNASKLQPVNSLRD